MHLKLPLPLPQDVCHYDKRYAEIQEFNKSNVWRKRGISMTTCRFTMTVGAKPATVHIYHGAARPDLHLGAVM